MAKEEAISAEPCEGCVGRRAVEMFLAADITDMEVEDYISMVGKRIKDLPPVNPKQKMGHWITKIKSDLRGDMWPTNPKCSECGGEPYYHNTICDYKFCPYCGAKMEESK